MLDFVNVRLSIPARLALIGCLFVVPIFFLSYLFVQQALNDIAFSEKEIEGTRYLAEIWPRFAAAASNDHVSPVAAPARAFYDAALGTAQESNEFHQASDPTAILETGKNLIAAVADNSNLTLDTDIDSFYLMNAETVKMPRISSAAQDIAAAVAEATSSPSRNARVAVAVDRLKSSLSGAISSIATARKYNPDGLTDKALAGPSAALKKAGDALLASVQGMVSGSGDVNKVTNAQRELLDATNSVWGLTNAELARLLQARIDRLFHTMKVNLAFAGMFLLTAAALSLFIARGLADRMAGLLIVMDRLVVNDVAVDIPYLSDVNETGRIAKALATFKQTLLERSQLKSEKSLIEQLAAERQVNEEAREAVARRQAEVVSAVARCLGRLAEADLTIMLDVPFPVEFDKLRSDLNLAAKQLCAAMVEIADVGQTVNAGSAEISAALGDLQARTERQAASIEQTASALGEITANVKSSAEGADHARKLVAAADDNARRSTSVVTQAVEAMGDIAKSAREISPIIGLMDEIAFQTNLLALNAGVEAARAGDAGRGFAVVASEVRALAQRSAEAAKEIKALILQSTTQIDQGVKLVEETGRSLELIRNQVGEINSIIVHIATGAGEQATGLGEINAALDQMDQTTQQNAAMVEQSTTACRALAGEAEHLASLISRFETGEAASHGRDSMRPVSVGRYERGGEAGAGGLQAQFPTRRSAA